MELEKFVDPLPIPPVLRPRYWDKRGRSLPSGHEDRRPFDAQLYNQTGELRYTGPAVPPDPNERGWKDTVRSNGSEVTRIIAIFKPFTGRYVWHCHLLEHEDYDMMRPFEVVAEEEEGVSP